MMVKEKRSLLKRITAFVLAILMVFTLMPWESYVTFAEEEGAGEEVNTSVTYSFVVTDEDGDAVEGATVYLYDISEDTDAESTLYEKTGADGKVTFSSQEDEKVAEADIYKVVSSDGEFYVRGMLTDDSEIEVTLSNVGLHLSCIVSLNDAIQAGAKVYLFQKSNEADVEDKYVTQQVTDKNGFVQFTSGLEAGSYEVIVITDTHIGIATKEITEQNVTDAISGVVDLSIVPGELVFEEKNDAVISMTSNSAVLSLGQSVAIEAKCDSTIKIGESEFTYESKDTKIATVDKDGNVTAVGKGTTTITVTMATEEYNIATDDYSVTVDGADIVGTVKDISNQPISGAVAKLMNGETVMKEMVVSNGEYKFEAIGEGEYSVKIECAGYGTVSKGVTVTENKEVTVDAITIERDSYYIEGTVTDKFEKPLEGVTVKLVEGEITSLEAIKDENTKSTVETELVTVGENTVAKYVTGYVAPETTYTLVFIHEKYGTHFETVNIASTDIQQETISLKEIVTIQYSDKNVLINKDATNDLNSAFKITKASDNSEITDLNNFTFSYEVETEETENTESTEVAVPAIEIDSETGAITKINAVGAETVTVIVSSEMYEINAISSDLSYEVNVWEFAFADDTLKNTVTKTYGAENFSTKVILKGAGDDVGVLDLSKVSYSSSKETIAKITNVFEEASENVADVQIQITGVSAETTEPEVEDVTKISAIYNGATLSYNVKVSKSDAAIINWDNLDSGTKNYVYGSKEEPETITASISGADDTAKIEYSSSDPEIVSIEKKTGKIEIKDTTGEDEKVTITAQIVSTNYVTKEVSYDITVSKGEQDIFGWQNADGKPFVFDEEPNQIKLYFDGTVPVIKAGGVEESEYNIVTYKLYKLVDGENGEKIEVEDTEGSVIEFNTETGEFTKIKGIGTAIVKATVAPTEDAVASGNAHYNEKTISYTVVISKATNPQLKWNVAENESTDRQYKYNEEVKNPLTASVVDSTNIKIKYSSSNPDIVSVDEETGELIINDIGIVNIIATTDSLYYEEQTDSYKIEVIQGEQNEFGWQNADGSQYDFGETPNEVICKYDAEVPTIIAGGQHDAEADDVTYAVKSLDGRDGCAVSVDASTGEITINRVGEAEITATVKAKRHFESKDITYKITITKAEQDDFKWNKVYTEENPLEVTYAPEPSKVTVTDISAIGACEEATVTYTSSNGDIATVNENGVVTINNADENLVEITATATVPDDGNYITKDISYFIKVNQSAHTNFAWEGGNPGTIKLTYEDTPETYVATGQCENATITYSSSDTKVATVDENTGVVTIKKAGEVTITATAAATRNYKATSISYKIVIAKKAQSMSFAQETYILVNGDNKFVSPVITTQSTMATAGKIVYSVPENNGVATINASTGEVLFTLQPGTVTITATKPEDEQYLATTATYTLTVQEWDPLKEGNSASYYTITGTQKAPESTWFNYYSEKDVLQLVGKNAYVLYKSTEDPVPSTNWNSAIQVTNVHEGVDNSITFYIKDKENGFVSRQYTVNDIKVDSIIPTASITIDKVTIWDKILSFFTFNIAGQKNPEMKIDSSDTLSGVKEVYYYISNTTTPLEKNGVIDVIALEKEANWKSYYTVVNLEDEKVTKNVIYAKVVDIAGNISYAATNGLIFDGTKPVLTPAIVTKNVNGYYNKDVEIKLDVTDAEPYSGIKKIAYVVENTGTVTQSGTLYEFMPSETDNPNHSELLREWNSVNYGKNVIVNAQKNNSDDVKVTFTVVDNAGNVSTSVVNLKFDITDPVIRVNYDNNNGDETFKDSVYFNTDRQATITVTERHFNADKFLLEITNTDGVVPELSEWKLSSKGTGNGDDTTYTATVYFSEDGDYTFGITCADEAGNKCGSIDYGKSQAPTAFVIDKTKPIISINYDNNAVLNNKYYKEKRTATIVIDEHNFDASRVNVMITAKDGKKTVETPVISKWDTVEDKHTATITFTKDANYTFDIEYVDKAGNSIDDIEKQTFYVDKTIPEASIAINKVTIWEKILSFFTFGLAGQDNPKLKISSSDALSGVNEVYYYISDTTEPLVSNGVIDTKALEKEAKWKNYEKTVDLSTEEVTKNVIYAKVVDKAGNITYTASNGLIFDGTKPVITPTVVTKAVNGYYNKDVKIKLDVEDAEPYSGIKEITYVVENAGKVTDKGTLYTFKPKKEGNPKHSELLSKWNSDKYGKNVIVDASKNNSDKVSVTFTVTDNAGNTTESVVKLKIDNTDPVINVTYDNNSGDATFTDGVFFNTDRTATITVSERHFEKDNFVLKITNSDGTIPKLSEWKKTTKGTGNGDNTTYTATVYFGTDGDYTLDIAYTDEAGNKCDAVNYGESQAPKAFTIDKTIPTISITYDNNDALNENYFKADRTATIVIQEHNFDASRVNAIIGATDNGEPVAAPTISGWSTSGDTHTATLSYSSDALYTFDIEYLDKAGNSIADVEEQNFYVDKTMPQVSITEIVDQSANNAEEIGFVVTATDTNFDVFTPVLTAVIQTENGITTTEMNVGSISEINNGQVYTVDNLDVDGIYSITCTVVDKAGNAYTEVSLQRADGSTYVENRADEDTLIMFSVNRDGSTFAVDDRTQSVLDSEYIQNVEDDIVIYEVNTNELVTYVLTLNGVELTEGTDYTISSTGGNGTWMRYTYTITKELFENEGEYVLVISSTDGAQNDAFSDVKDTNISFVVDRTAPIVTVTGMESGRSYQTDVQTVTVMPTDDGGIIETLTINFVDREGNITKNIFDKSGDELRTLLEENGGVITFELSDVVNTNIQIICTDKAFGTNGVSNTFNQIYENITVSASAVAIFFAGNTIYYILGGVGATGAAGIGIATFFRKRKGSKIKNG